MSLITLILTLAIVGFLLWLVLTYIPMPDPFKKVIMVVVVIAVILWLLNGFGWLGGGPTLNFKK
jgi:hypothetical protein